MNEVDYIFIHAKETFLPQQISARPIARRSRFCSFIGKYNTILIIKNRFEDVPMKELFDLVHSIFIQVTNKKLDVQEQKWLSYKSLEFFARRQPLLFYILGVFLNIKLL